MLDKKIPKSAVSRVSIYLRELTRLEKEGKDSVSSIELGELTDLTDAQVRKDLSYFGQFGKSGLGYEVSALKKVIENLFGKNRVWPIALAGVGNIGQALLSYPGFINEGFLIKEAFDVDPKKIDKRYGEVTIKDIKNAVTAIEDGKIKIAIVATPAENAQSVADMLIKAGVKCILNFAPALIKVSASVVVKNMDVSSELENLSFYLMSQEE